MDIKTLGLAALLVACGGKDDDTGGSTQETDTDTDVLPGCPSGKTPITPTGGAGTCADPLVIGMTTVTLGDIVTFDTGAVGIDEPDPYDACGTFPKGAARDTISQVPMPKGYNGLIVSVDAATGPTRSSPSSKTTRAASRPTSPTTPMAWTSASTSTATRP